MAQIKLNIVTNIDEKASANIKAVSTSLEGLAKSLNTIKPNKELTKQLSALARSYQSMTRNLNAELKQAKITTETAKANKLAAQTATEKAKATKVAAQTAIDNAKADKVAAQAANELAKAKGVAARNANDAKRAEAQMLNAQTNARKQEWKEIQAATKATQNNTKSVKQSTQANEKHTQSILSMASGFLKWQLAATLIMKPLQKLREAISSINETLVVTEDTIIGLQRVLDETLANEEISDKLYELAQRYGQTFENVSTIATNFARTGMSWVDTIKATEAALLALNVAELDAAQASDGMIAIMQQFGKEASDLEGIIDMLNKTADGFAVSTDKLLKALQRTGSSAKNANLTLEETIGIVAALSEATGRSGENLGTAVNSLIQYSSKASALDIFASLDEGTANMVEKYRQGAATILDVWEEVSRVINNMDSRQESILSDLANSEDIKDLNSELSEELGDIFEQVNDVYGTANTFRKNYFIALLGNMQTVKEAAETAMDSAGYSQNENLQYMNTYTAKVNQLDAAWQQLANDEQGWLAIKKGFVEMGIGILKLIENVGGLQTALAATATVSTLLFGKRFMTSAMDFIANIKKSETSVWNLHKNLKLLKTSQAEAAQATAQATALRNAANTQTVSATTKIQLLAKAEELETVAAQKNAMAKQAQAASYANYLTYAMLVITAVTAIAGAIDESREKAEAEQMQGISDSIEELSKYGNELSETQKKYDELTESIKQARQVLDDETSTTAEAANARIELRRIQDELIKSNGKYADSIDLINGNLQGQLDLLKDISDEELKTQAAEFLKNNQDSIYNAKNLTGGKGEPIRVQYGIKGNAYDNNFGTSDDQDFIDFLNSYHMKPVWDYETEVRDFWDWWATSGTLTDLIGGAFGGDTLQLRTDWEDASREQIGEYYEKLIKILENDTTYTDEQKERFTAYLRGAINQLFDEDYTNAKNLLEGNKEGANLFEIAGAELLQQLVDGKITVEEFEQAIAKLTETEQKNVVETTELEKALNHYDDVVKEVSEETKDFAETLNEVNAAQKTLSSAMQEQNQNGHISLSTMTALIQSDNDYIKALEIENGTIRLNVKLAEEMLQAKREEMLLDTLVAENKKKAAAEEAKAVVESEIAKMTAYRATLETQLASATSIQVMQVLKDAWDQTTNILLNLESTLAKYNSDIFNYDQTIELIQGIVNGTLEWSDGLEDVSNKTDEVIDKQKELRDTILEALRAERDLENDSLTLAEKRLNVEKERQDLINSFNQRTTSVYNALTGQFEYQADADAVRKETEEYQGALDDYNSYIESQAWEEVEESVENGVHDLDSILAIVSRWAALSLGEKTPEWANTILSVIGKYQEGGEITDIPSVEASVYDPWTGRTYHPDGTVTDPALAKIMLEDNSPFSLQEYFKQRGFLSVDSNAVYTPRREDIVYNMGANTISSNDNRVYVNGIPMPPNFARDTTIEEAFNLFSLTND